MDKIVSLSRRRGFVFPSSEVYGGLGSTYDYGHYGVLMKNNIRSLWFDAMVRERDDIVALPDRKSTRLNSSHDSITYAVLEAKNKKLKKSKNSTSAYRLLNSVNAPKVRTIN